MNLFNPTSEGQLNLRDLGSLRRGFSRSFCGTGSFTLYGGWVFNSPSNEMEFSKIPGSSGIDFPSKPCPSLGPGFSEGS